MSMGFKLQQRLTQQMVMTPQLQQAIKLLQLSSLELEAFIDEELLENPTLEAVDEGADSPDDGLTPQEREEIDGSLAPAAPADEPSSGLDQAPAATLDGQPAAEAPLEAPAEDPGGLPEAGIEAGQEADAAQMAADLEWDNYLDSYSYSLPPAAGEGRDSEEGRSLESSVSPATTLAEHLARQVGVSARFDEDERPIALRLLGDLDERGYLPEDVCAAAAAELGVPAEQVEQVLGRMQELDPPGVCARTLSECLATQARLLGVTDELVYRLIADHLPQLARRQLAPIARALGVSLAAVEQAVAVIVALEPRPARNFTYLPAETIRPDVYLYRAGGEWVIVVDSSGKARLRVSSYYRQLLGNGKEARGYLQERFNRARWLVRSIFHRERTLYRVTECIVRFQRPFFDSGDVTQLRPLVLRAVADELGLNESTISRATANKYLSCPHGTFGLKYFFNTSIQRDGGEDLASVGVREHIRKLVTGEDPARPVSDQQIVTLLKDQGIVLARRTVAKYREMMGILPSASRRRAGLGA